MRDCVGSVTSGNPIDENVRGNPDVAESLWNKVSAFLNLLTREDVTVVISKVMVAVEVYRYEIGPVCVALSQSTKDAYVFI